MLKVSAYQLVSPNQRLRTQSGNWVSAYRLWNRLVWRETDDRFEGADIIKGRVNF